MQDIVLGFPLLNGGEEEGLNDAGIETFEGDIGDYIARECGQNTSDASTGGKVELHFDMQKMSVSDLPCIEGLKRVFEQCREYWSADLKAMKFFDTGLRCMEEDILPVLKISDYGTTGLTGEDSDRTSKWFGLVRSKGACNKTEGSAGSFGIGKYAPFAASALRTIYYYTRTENNDAFQGISRLVTHCNDEKQQTQATGYIGRHEVNASGHKYSSIRDRSLIPAHFLRNEDRLGTDIYIPAYRAVDNWKESLTVSALNNFWPAICLGKILFKIGDKTIDSSNIDSCIEEYRMNPELTAYRYFRAYRNGQLFSEKLKHVGYSELKLRLESQRESNPIAVARATGMIIETWGHFRSRKPICGVYICKDPHGNEVLRQLEPPRHDKWDKNRSQNGKEVLTAIRDWVRYCIEQLIPADTTESYDLPGASKYIPIDSDEEEGEEPFEQDNESENQDGFEPTPVKPQKNITKAVISPGRVQVDEEEQDTQTSETGEGYSGGRGDGEGKGGGGHGGGGGEGKGEGGTGVSASATASVRVLKLRYIFDNSDSSYKMIVRSKSAFEGDISFGAECDDGTTEPVLISKVLWNNNEMALKNERKSFSAKIQPNAPEIFLVSFEHNEKLSLRIV